MDIILNTRFNNPNLPVIPVPGFYDDFDRGAANTLGVTSQEGRAWTQHNLGSLKATWSTTGNGSATLTTPSSSWQLTTLDGLSNNGVLETTINYAPGNHWGGIVFRVQDSRNFLAVMPFSKEDHRLTLKAHYTSRQTALGTADVPPSDFKLQVRLSNNNIDVFVDDVLTISAESSAHATNTQHGLYAINGTTTEWEYLKFNAE